MNLTALSINAFFEKYKDLAPSRRSMFYRTLMEYHYVMGPESKLLEIGEKKKTYYILKQDEELFVNMLKQI
jgi:hypothetical protein